jgi:uncharacterized protein (TIGR02466 family)
MNQTQLFPTIVFEEKTSQIDNVKISKKILEREKTTPARKISNYGGWQSEHYTEDNDFKEITEFAEKTFTEIFKEFYTPEGSFVLAGFWVNVNRYKDFNYSHIHGNHDWSFTYYIKVPKKSGNIVFIDPRVRRVGRQGAVIKNLKDNYFSHDLYFIPAIEGVLVFFPSYLEHYVQPNETKEPRISLSGNINLKL